MFKATYYKFGQRWYIDLPEYIEQGGNPDDLEQVGAFHNFLELASAGESTISFFMDTQCFEGADKAIRTGTSGGKSGGYYHIATYAGNAVDFELWINTVLYLMMPELSLQLYFKKSGLEKPD